MTVSPSKPAHVCYYTERFLGPCAGLRKAIVSFVMSVLPHGTTRVLLDGFWWNLVFDLLFRKSAEKVQVSLNLTRITCTLHEHVFTFITISRWILHRMRNVLENQHTHFVFSNCFRKSCRLWDNVEKYGARGHKWRIRITCWISKAARARMHTPSRPGTRTHCRYKYVILLFHGNSDSRTRVIVALYAHCVSSCFWRL